MLSGAANYLRKEIAKKYACKVRGIEFNLTQRCSAALISKTDRDEAIMAGRFGVQSALEGKSGFMIAFDRLDGADYKIECSLKDVDIICNKEKQVPDNMISEDGVDVTQDFMDYCGPLLYGNIDVPKDENGLPKFAFRKPQK